MNNNNITNEDKKLLYYKTLGILNNNNKILKGEELIKNLFDKVKKPKNETYITGIEKNMFIKQIYYLCPMMMDINMLWLFLI